MVYRVVECMMMMIINYHLSSTIEIIICYHHYLSPIILIYHQLSSSSKNIIYQHHLSPSQLLSSSSPSTIIIYQNQYLTLKLYDNLHYNHDYHKKLYVIITYPTVIVPINITPSRYSCQHCIIITIPCSIP